MWVSLLDDNVDLGGEDVFIQGEVPVVAVAMPSDTSARREFKFNHESTRSEVRRYGDQVKVGVELQINPAMVSRSYRLYLVIVWGEALLRRCAQKGQID